MTSFFVSFALIFSSEIHFSYSVSLNDFLGLKLVETRSTNPDATHEPDYAHDAECRTTFLKADFRLNVPDQSDIHLNCDAWFQAVWDSAILSGTNSPLRRLDINLLTNSSHRFSSRTIQKNLRTFRFGLYDDGEQTPADQVRFLSHEFYHLRSLSRYNRVGYKVPYDDPLFVAAEEARAELSTLCKRTYPVRPDLPAPVTKSDKSENLMALLNLVQDYGAGDISRNLFSKKLQTRVKGLELSLSERDLSTMCQTLLAFENAVAESDYLGGTDKLIRALHLKW